MSDAQSKEYKRVKEKREELEPLFARMKTDENIYLLEPYKMMMLAPYDSSPMPDVANVTLNDPLLFGTKSVAIMGSATMQTVVEGREMKDPQTTKVEEFLADAYVAIDDRLTNKGIISLEGFVNEQMCLRGRTAARCCLRYDKVKGLVLDVLPVDAYCFAAEYDSDKMVWGAPWFQRKKAQIEAEYGITFSGTEGEVVDYWDEEKNVVFVDENIVKEQENPYKYVPCAEAICPIGSMMSTELASSHRGESILWPNRKLWAEKNRTATILQTLSILALFGPMQYVSDKGENATKPAESPYGHRKVHPVQKGGGYKAMPVGDIKNATRLFYAVLDASLQKGSLAVVDYGTLNFPLAAIAITRLSGSRDDIFLPRVHAKAVFYQALSRMIINQCIAFGKKVTLGQPGAQNDYSPGDLKGDYSINYRFFTVSKEQEIANLQIAAASEGFLSPDTIRREVLNLKDPDGEETKFLSHQAEQSDEVLFLYRRARHLIDNKQELEGYILAKRIVTILRHRKLQQAALEAQEKQVGAPATATGGNGQGKPGQLMPLLAEGRGGGGASRSGQQMPTEPTEESEIREEENV